MVEIRAKHHERPLTRKFLESHELENPEKERVWVYGINSHKPRRKGQLSKNPWLSMMNILEDLMGGTGGEIVEIDTYMDLCRVKLMINISIG